MDIEAAFIGAFYRDCQSPLNAAWPDAQISALLPIGDLYVSLIARAVLPHIARLYVLLQRRKWRRRPPRQSQLEV